MSGVILLSVGCAGLHAHTGCAGLHAHTVPSSLRAHVVTPRAAATMGLGDFIGRFRKKREVEAAPQVEVGATLPDIDVQVLPPFIDTTEQEDDANIGILPEVKTCTIVEALGPGKSLLVGMPGAFTPTCTDKHLPGYMRNAEKLQEYGVNKIAIVTTNDRFTNDAWRQKLVECEGQWAEGLDIISDGDADLVKALGMVGDMGFGLGARSKRFTLMCDDGVVSQVAIDEGMEVLDVTDAEKFVKQLAPPSTASTGADMSDEQQKTLAGVALVALLVAFIAYSGDIPK